MSDSFEKAMSDVRESIHNFLIASGYYDTMFLPELLGNIDLLETAHKKELEHTKKAEYRRGHVDGANQRKTETWRLDHDRAEVLARLVNYNLESGSAMRSLGFVLGVDWSRDNTTRSLGKIKARLAYLLGGAVEDPKLQKSPNLEDGEDESDTSCETSDETTVSITSDLRKYVDDNTYKPCRMQPYCFLDIPVLNKLLDDIDATFDRIYERQESVLKGTIVELCEKVKNQREQLATYETMLNFESIRDLKRERNELRCKVRHCESIERKLAEAKENIADIERERNECKARAESVTQHNYAFELKLHKAERDNRMYRTMLNDAAEEYKLLRKNNCAMRREIFNRVPKEYHDEKLSEKQWYLDNAVRRVEMLGDECSRLKSDCDMYRTMLNDAADEFKLLREEYECCRDERNAWMARFVDVVRDLRNLSDEDLFGEGLLRLPVDADGKTIYPHDLLEPTDDKVAEHLAENPFKAILWYGPDEHGAHRINLAVPANGVIAKLSASPRDYRHVTIDTGIEEATDA